ALVSGMSRISEHSARLTSEVYGRELLTKMATYQVPLIQPLNRPLSRALIPASVNHEPTRFLAEIKPRSKSCRNAALLWSESWLPVRALSVILGRDLADSALVALSWRIAFSSLQAVGERSSSLSAFCVSPSERAGRAFFPR